MDAAKAELLRALGKLVRGLSTLFWTLPAGMIVYMETARTEWLGFLDGLAFVPAVVVGGVCWYSLHQMRAFQKQERVWRQSLIRAEALAIINTGLAPFLFWWHRFPSIPFFIVCVSAFAFAVLLFLIQINRVLWRLCAMLPDENLRDETRMFTKFNIVLFLLTMAGLALYLGMTEAQLLPRPFARLLIGDSPRGLWAILFLSLLPLALTMAILWRIKEVLFLSVFEAEH